MSVLVCADCGREVVLGLYVTPGEIESRPDGTKIVWTITETLGPMFVCPEHGEGATARVVE